MKTEYPVDWVKATPSYVLSTLQNEWRECALSEDDPERAQQGPTFATTVHEWREAMDLVPARALGQALNQTWGTHFSGAQWSRVLEPARTRTLKDVCELLATEARRPVVPAVKLMGQDCPAAGVFRPSGPCSSDLRGRCGVVLPFLVFAPPGCRRRLLEPTNEQIPRQSPQSGKPLNVRAPRLKSSYRRDQRRTWFRQEAAAHYAQDQGRNIPPQSPFAHHSLRSLAGARTDEHGHEWPSHHLEAGRTAG